ncbi:transcriptional regulator [Caballeronia sp. LZ029]|uniref:helix-turn-helix transcriptional regulator n=1 Tax=Caballeronia sp. LZ029 TaxID=3038564 RepID=UPI002864A4E6|nr:transcriptional regulator [Caballeronia sp. LZ029]MDR5741576.1 transcriptional regulator [Caballeronia sp. LZ029]
MATTTNTTSGALSIDTARAARARTPATPSNETMPATGLGRWRTFGRFVGVSREKWRLLVLEGKAPQPIRMGIRCSLYEYAEIHQWLSDPLNYRAPAPSSTGAA